MRNSIAVFSVILCLFLTFQAHAQTVAGASDAGATIEPEARRLMERMIGAYKKLDSYSGSFEVTETNPQAKWGELKARIIYQKPNKGRIILTSRRGSTMIVSDGNSLFTTDFRDTTKFAKTKAPASLDDFGGIFDAVGGYQFPILLQGENPLDRYKNTIKSAFVGNSSMVDGVRVDNVVVVSTGPMSTSTTIYSIGQEDFLLRRAVGVSTVYKGGTTTIEIETHANVKANPLLPASTFVFTPPAKSKTVDSTD